MMKIFGLVLSLSASSAFTLSGTNKKWDKLTSLPWQVTNINENRKIGALASVRNSHANVSVFRVRQSSLSDGFSPMGVAAHYTDSLQVATDIEFCDLKDVDYSQSTSSQEDQVLQLINEERKKRGMTSFCRDPCLDYVAQHGTELLLSGGHGGRSLGDTLKQRIQSSGYENVNVQGPQNGKKRGFWYGELYQTGSPSISDLLKNAKHCHTLLGPDFDGIGVSMANRQGHDHKGSVLVLTLASIRQEGCRNSNEIIGTHQQTIHNTDHKLGAAPNLPTTSTSHHPQQQQQQSTSSDSLPQGMSPKENRLAKEVFQMTNQVRAEFGFPALTRNKLLDMAAFRHAADMHQRHYFNHATPEGVTPDQRIERTGYLRFDTFGSEGWQCRTATGENIASGQPTPFEVVSDWMNSPTHRANILSQEFLELGVGVYDDHWVQCFGAVDLKPVPGRI
jgi:uncharacterized protein YkwD